VFGTDRMTLTGLAQMNNQNSVKLKLHWLLLLIEYTWNSVFVIHNTHTHTHIHRLIHTHTRHVVFAPSSANTYAGSVFPDISDSIFSATQ